MQVAETSEWGLLRWSLIGRLNSSNVGDASWRFNAVETVEFAGIPELSRPQNDGAQKFVSGDDCVDWMIGV